MRNPKVPLGDPLGLVGTLLADKYRIESVVARTSLSVVYRAVHRLWKRPVAIKAFRANGYNDEQRSALLEAFVREGALLVELSEKTAAVCQARDMASTVTAKGEWVPYMVLEWLDGQPLDVVLASDRANGNPPRSLDRALQLLSPVARALCVAHDRGIVHRDIKPGNICVLAGPMPDTPTAKLYDFGIALSLHESATASTEKVALDSFTPGYAAPEQFCPEVGPIGPWTDVFALALVFLEVITGKDALVGDTVDELRARACDPHDRPTPRSHSIHVGDGVERVLARALALRPLDRYAHAGDFWTALTQAAKDRFIHEATAPILLTRLVRPRPQRPRWVWPAIALVSEAAFLAAVTYWPLVSQMTHHLGQVISATAN
jgi:serine/threonine protein kinase